MARADTFVDAFPADPKWPIVAAEQKRIVARVWTTAGKHRLVPVTVIGHPPWDDPGTRRSAERGSGVGGKAADSLANSDRFLEDVCDHRRSGLCWQLKPSPLVAAERNFYRRLAAARLAGSNRLKSTREMIAVSRICRPILLPNNSRWSWLPMRWCLLDVGTFDIRSITRSNL